MDLPLPETLFTETAAKVIYHPSPLIIGSAVFGKDDSDAFIQIPPPPQISFRAAAVANMIYRPLKTGDDAYSFTWKTGKLHWLPSIRNMHKSA
jgi:hypothetical protein